MINQKELRLGNFILSGNKIITVDAIFEHTGSLPDEHYKVKECNPIPLTEEWLLKLGFEINDDAGNWHSPNHTIYTNKKTNFSVGKTGEYFGYYNQVDDDFYSTFYPKIEFVHHLQNLYFAIKGKEIEVMATSPLP